jgi:hypothetical protein
MMSFLTAVLSFMCFSVAPAHAAHDGHRSEGNDALRRAWDQLREESSEDDFSLLQAGVQEKMNQAEGKRSASEDVEETAEACESLEKGSRYLDTEKPSDIPEFVTKPASEFVTEQPEATLEEEPYGAATLKISLEVMVVMLFVDGLRRWLVQQQEKEGREKAKAAVAETETEVDRAWQELVLAATAGDELRVEKALTDELPVQRTDMWGCAPLHFAAVGGSAKVASELLKRGAEVDALDACDESALHFAARAGHPGICEVLLNSGANVNLVNDQEMTPLVVAGHAKQEATCRFLADNGGHAGGMADQDLPPLVICQVMRKVLEAA